MNINIKNNFSYPNGISLNRKNVSCKGYVNASRLKNIEGNICACCGNEMISSKQLSSIWAKVSLPLSEIIRSDCFEKVKKSFPVIYKTLLSFSKIYPKKPFSEIVLDDSNHTKFISAVTKSFAGDPDYYRSSGVAREKLKKDRTMGILTLSEATLVPASKVMETMAPLRKYLHDYRGDIFDEFVALSKRYPDKRLSEIIRIPEVAAHNVEETYHYAMKFAKTRDLHMNNANDIILADAPQAKDDLKRVYTEICSIYSAEHDPKRLIYMIKNLYKELVIKYNLFDSEKKIMDEIEQMPSVQFNKNSFLAYARRYFTDGAILDSIMKPFMESEEHLIPLSCGGGDSIYNKLIICRKCNRDRSWYPHKEFLEYHPEMIENAQKQIQFYEEGVLSGKIASDLRDYPIEVAKSLYECTNGLINFDVSDYIQKLANQEILPEGF